MKFNKIILVILYISIFLSSAQSSQKNILNNLFNQLEKVNNSKSAEFGTELMQYGDYNYALKIFDNIIDTDPKWSEAWNKRATVYFLMSQLTNSLDDIDKVLNIEPRHFGALSGQARIFLKLQKYEKAIKSIERALKFYPSFKSGEMIPKIERLIREESI